MTDSATLNAMSTDWAERRGLIMMTDWAGTTTLGPLLPAGHKPQSWRGDYDLQALLDHSRHFRAPKGKKPSVAASAPYARNLLERIGDWDKIVDIARWAAAAAGLEVRIGVASDTIYRGRLDSVPVVPFVWWDRSRVDLEALELARLVPEA